MKNEKKIVFIGLIFVFMFIFIGINSSNGLESNNNLNLSQDELPRYTEIFEDIYIDGNFSDVVERFDWASGRGDIFDPYTIRAVSFMTNVTLMIENVEFFKVEDCSFFNYSRSYSHYIFAGLSIGNSKFGIIQNNIFTNCSNGISLYDDAEDIQVLNNNFIGSHNDTKTGMGKAILIHDVISVIIEENRIYGYYDGICVFNAGKIYISNNRIETLFGHISDTGIYFMSVNDSSIVTNDFYGCTFDGHDYDVITSDNEYLKLSAIEGCFNLIIYGNKFYDLDGNLIGMDEIEFNPIFWIMSIILLVSVIVSFIVVIIYFRRKN